MMADVPDIEAVELQDEYIHVRFRDPGQFDDIRTPDWAAEVAQTVSESSEVRTGEAKRGDDWKLQAVLVEKHVGEEKAKEQARDIAAKLEE